MLTRPAPPACLPVAVVEECEVTKLVAVIDPKTKEKKKAKFAKSGAMCVARIKVEKSICIEAFDSVPQVGCAASVRCAALVVRAALVWRACMAGWQWLVCLSVPGA